MAWDTEMVIMVRYIIGDFDETDLTYADSRISQAILASAMLLRTYEDFDGEYTIDIANTTISPDPTEHPRDDPFVTLVCLKTACLILAGEIRRHSCQAMSIRDGPSTIDLTGIPKNLAIIYKDICEKYEQALFDHQRGLVLIGHVVLGPYNAGYLAHGNDLRSDRNIFN
jgi:hypothetical protein